MFTWLKNLFFDETKFIGFMRFALLGVGMAVMNDSLDLEQFGIPSEVGIGIAAIAGLIRSSSTGKKGDK